MFRKPTGLSTFFHRHRLRAVSLPASVNRTEIGGERAFWTL